MQSAGLKPSNARAPLAGLVERVTFHNADSGFCVLCIKVRGHRDLVTVLGAAPSITAGEYIQASGVWENHREHGLQFRAALMHVTAPTSTEGMEKYLGSGLIKGIGPAFAQRLMRAFNEQLLRSLSRFRTDYWKLKVSGPSAWRSCRVMASGPRGRCAYSKRTA